MTALSPESAAYREGGRAWVEEWAQWLLDIGYPADVTFRAETGEPILPDVLVLEALVVLMADHPSWIAQTERRAGVEVARSRRVREDEARYVMESELGNWRGVAPA